MTDSNIVGILLKPAHNDEPCVLHLAFDDSKGTQQCQNILDGHDAHDRTDRDRSTVIRQLRNMAKTLHVNPVRHNVDFLGDTSKPLGNLPIVTKQRIETVRAGVREPRKIVEIADPEPLEVRLDPVALDDLRLTLA